jgi:hypothetical protein
MHQQLYESQLANFKKDCPRIHGTKEHGYSYIDCGCVTGVIERLGPAGATTSNAIDLSACIDRDNIAAVQAKRCEDRNAYGKTYDCACYVQNLMRDLTHKFKFSVPIQSIHALGGLYDEPRHKEATLEGCRLR